MAVVALAAEGERLAQQRLLTVRVPGGFPGLQKEVPVHGARPAVAVRGRAGQRVLLRVVGAQADRAEGAALDLSAGGVNVLLPVPCRLPKKNVGSWDEAKDGGKKQEVPSVAASGMVTVPMGDHTYAQRVRLQGMQPNGSQIVSGRVKQNGAVRALHSDGEG